ncbi:MAG: DUF2059 domain-containing protein [Burkholderiales bacterium]|jgi:hypothetical protein|nr:DUF2059 domain-containing protein [Burkholderiales bacterium]
MKTHIRTLAAAFILLGMATAPAVAQSKKELVDRIVLLQQPGVEAMARSMGEQPAAQLVMQARQIIQNVPADKRDAAVKNIDAELKKYGDDVVPLLRDRAVKIAPTIIGPELDKNFNEAELKQLIDWLESPVIKRFQDLTPNIQRSLSERLVNETRAQVEPKLTALEAAMAKQLGVTPNSSGPAPAALPGNRGGSN